MVEVSVWEQNVNR